jgi:quercetin dioxygenase-like cupin family protein
MNKTILIFVITGSVFLSVGYISGFHIGYKKANSIFAPAIEASTLDNPSFNFPQSPDSKILGEGNSSWDGGIYKSYLIGEPRWEIVKITIPPNYKLKSHRHPVPSFIYVERGALTVTKLSMGQEKKLEKGDVLAEAVNQTHFVKTRKEGVDVIVFYV